MRLTHDLLDQTKIDRSESIDLILTSNWLLCSNSIYRIDARSTTKTHLPFHSGEPELRNDIESIISIKLLSIIDITVMHCCTDTTCYTAGWLWEVVVLLIYIYFHCRKTIFRKPIYSAIHCPSIRADIWPKKYTMLFELRWTGFWEVAN